MSAILLLILLSYEDDLPSLMDAQRLPPYPEIFELRRIAFANLEELKARYENASYGDRASLQSAIQEQMRIYAWYDWAVVAVNPNCNDRYRRVGLEYIRAASPYHYYSGTLPPCVPCWRLRWHQ